MRLTSRVLVFTLGLCGLIPSANAAVISEEYSSFWVFGGSMSDNGNSARNRGLPARGATDGKVWNEPVISEFQAAGKMAGNFAHGGATALGDAFNRTGENGTVDLKNQAGIFSNMISSDMIGNRGLAAVWVGSNDIGNLSSVLNYRRPRTLNSQIVAYSNSIAQAVSDTVDRIAAKGISDFLIFNSVDVGRLPYVSSLSYRARDALTKATVAFNDALESKMAASPYRTEMVDVFGLSVDVDNTIKAGGSIYGVDTLGPCTGWQGGDCATSAYWDGVHFTQTMHNQVETQAREALAPAPGIMSSTFTPTALTTQKSFTSLFSAPKPLFPKRSFSFKSLPRPSFGPASISNQRTVSVAPVPLPAAGWFLLAGMGGLCVLRRTRKA